MDAITHMLLGGVTAQLGFSRRIGRSATWVAAGAAAAADLDIFLSRWTVPLADTHPTLAHMLGHRGLTHSLPATPLLALAIAGGWWAARRLWRRPAAGGTAVRFGLFYACVLVAAMTHPVLDWCTAFGTELLAPFTDTRYACDAVAVVDVCFTGLLVVALVVCLVIRKAGRGRLERAAAIAGWVGFLAAIGYLAAGRALHDRAIAQVLERSHIAPVVRADAYPSLGSILLWRVVIETDREYLVVRVRPLSGTDGNVVYAAAKQDGPWIDRARQLPAVQAYEWFAMDRVRAENHADGDDHVIEFFDLRYGTTTDSLDSLWTLRVRFDRDGNVTEARRTSPYPNMGFWQLAARTWQDIMAP